MLTKSAVTVGSRIAQISLHSQQSDTGFTLY